MNWKQLKAAILGMFLFFVGCGHEQQLTSIEIQPSTEIFGASNIPVSANAGANVQLRALGHYIHPPVTKDITSQVTWASNDVDLAVVSPSGLLTATGGACGNALISATVVTNHSTGNISSSGALVAGNMTANVVCFTGGPTLTVVFAGAGTGTVTSSPPGLNCSTSCTSSFTNGTTITLTGTANGGSAFGSWSGCDMVSGSACTLNNLTTARSVTITFN